LEKHSNNFNLIRLVAALQVFTVHLANHLGIEGPFVTALKIVPGVPAFFFISGLLICTAYERTRNRGKFVFFWNRVLRIYPALWICVAISTLMVIASGYLASQHFSVRHFAFWLFGQATMFQFYNPDFMRSFGVGVLNGALWTITVELQFYILTPLLYYLLTRRIYLLALLFLCSLALNVYLIYNLDWNLLYMKLMHVSFVPWVYMYICGFLAAYYRDLLSAFVKKLKTSLLIFSYIVSMLLVGSYETNASNSINPISFILLAGCLLKISTIRLPIPSVMWRYFSQHDFSYGIYLYHMPVLNCLIFFDGLSVIGTLVVAYPLVIGLAVLSWFLIERPALGKKR
jgi:peptidoglycan/LPS O-acetylase OafA/YrhL